MATNWLQTITKLTQLISLSLYSCDLPMVLPPSSFNVSNSLFDLTLTGNEFSSSWIFPLVFNLSSNLSFLDLTFNKLQGEIPISLGNMSSLTLLYLSDNQLTGDLPCSALSSSLTTLDLSHNMFNVTMTQCIRNLSKLESLFLFSNNFEDIITESHFFHLSQLQWLDLSSNPGISFNFSLGWNPPFQLTRVSLADCKVGPHFPTWLRTQTRLEYLDISNAEISGNFPDWFWESNPKLSSLNISHNNFCGVLPNLSLKFSTFDSIDLSFNHFNGSLPILPHNGSVLDLSSNEFFGSITNLCNETSCYWYSLDLSNNLLFGQLPNCFANLPNLKYLNLAHNNFSGKIFSPNICSSLHLQNNSFTGEIPTSLRNCTSLTFIDLSQNKLTGKIPIWVGDTWTELVFLSLSLVMLVGLNLSRNNLSGFLPSNIEQLRSLDFLDFSRNHFSGGIPDGFSQLDQLGVLDLSYNNLSGKIPKSIHLQTFNASAFEGNLGLCGPPLAKACPGDDIAQVPETSDNVDGMKNPEDEDKLINDGFYISMAVGFIFGFWGVCGTLVFNNSWGIAFFKLWNSVMDWLYVKIAISKIRLREAFHKFLYNIIHICAKEIFLYFVNPCN
ncbi:receptor protein-tyrosine kinase CEPR2-like [Olea europaea var. sylvestris]|uniref:receptor protein-tyrosine kinase CEPR2-like n=1 Tax=Olea europaea var. sylvestris TaxID=158386 RepID=UPI000C1D3A42|nr:receptor protein-tyrosine kinase CEPR2-like [Olea europaea var. sylvestris]